MAELVASSLKSLGLYFSFLILASSFASVVAMNAQSPLEDQTNVISADEHLTPSSRSSFRTLFDRDSQINICILSWSQYGGYEGPECGTSAPLEWGCNCQNSEYDCQNLLQAVTCTGNDNYGKCALRTDGKPMCSKPLDGEDCRPCRVDADCPTDGVFNRCVYIGEPTRSACADTPTLNCGTRVCMQFHDL